MAEPEWLEKARKEGRIRETAVNAGRLASDATAQVVALTVGECEGMTEKQFQARVMGLALANGWECYHTHDSRRSEAGFPDLVMVRGECCVFAELKREDGEPTEEQERWLSMLAHTHNEAYLWRPSNWTEIQKRLTRRD